MGETGPNFGLGEKETLPFLFADPLAEGNGLVVRDHTFQDHLACS
jgi:hypothetical protein